MTDNASEQDLITAVENYADSLRRTGKIKEQQFIKHPQNFLRDKTYLQYLLMCIVLQSLEKERETKG